MVGLWFAMLAHAAPHVLSADVAELRDALQGGLEAEACPVVLDAWYRKLEQIDPRDVDRADLQAHGAGLVQDVFEVQVGLHGLLQGLASRDALDRDCLVAIRRADLAARYLADYLLEVLPPEDAHGLWLTNPNAAFRGPEDIRAGDVLVTRATLISSAGIAHMGQVDSQFSHNVVVHVDDRGRAWTVEALMELGGITQTLEEFLPDRIGRVVVLRYHEPEVAARAAALAWERVHRGRPIRYDADFDYEDHEALFCSEVPRWVFGSLADPAAEVPFDLALTRLDTTGNPQLYEALGIPGELVSAPSDVLYDPRFELLAEWRDPSMLRSMRWDDAVVESAMRWMSDQGYVLDAGKAERRLVSTALVVRRIPLIGLALKARLHPHGDKEFLVSSLALQNAALAVLGELGARLEGREAGLVSYERLRAELEAIRVADLERWRQDPDTARFHRWLHPPTAAAAP